MKHLYIKTIALAALLFIVSGCSFFLPAYVQEKIGSKIAGQTGITTSLIGVVSLFAGGSATGSSTNMAFNSPTGIAVDKAGNVYVSLRLGHMIYKLGTNGSIIILAGSHTGYADGNGQSALFKYPEGLAVDDAGNVYVADSGNNCIRKITPSGDVSTLAGTTQSGYMDGTGTSARFNMPCGVAVFTNGVVYVADTGNNRIRKIVTNVVTTYAGSGVAGNTNGMGNSAEFNHPCGIAVNQYGILFVADLWNHSIRLIGTDTSVSLFAGTGGPGYNNGNFTASQFNFPYSIALDQSNSIYVADRDNNCIRKLDGIDTVSTYAGSTASGYTEGNVTNARFNAPRGVAISASGILYIADTENNRVRKIHTR